MARTKKDVKAHRKTKPHPAPKKDLSLVLKHFPTQYVKRPRNKRMVGTAEEKKRARAKVQQGYVKDLGVAIKVLQGKIPIVKDIQRRVSIHKVLRAAIHYIKHLQLTLEDKPVDYQF
ncbi:unnamed protein product [Caenorhabditis brenneri]